MVLDDQKRHWGFGGFLPVEILIACCIFVFSSLGFVGRCGSSREVSGVCFYRPSKRRTADELSSRAFLPKGEVKEFLGLSRANGGGRGGLTAAAERLQRLCGFAAVVAIQRARLRTRGYKNRLCPNRGMAKQSSAQKCTFESAMPLGKPKRHVSA
ncbi:hypothetical protein RHSIM_Rhsim09G0098500 [Rhododendron simsii]|uniref:Uncharacterized protein n=1 Tax=Rhododendron simsii TaxID=118357 RepID=A0A834LE09_RHOSS|nr:hypothetical protein RHSIM_Rhsim09G0098500 [Rhododendron simsii]